MALSETASIHVDIIISLVMTLIRFFEIGGLCVD
jgi:hypothetical protein